MPNITFVLKKTDENGQTYGHPSYPDLTVRVKQTSAPKRLVPGDVRVENHVTEIIVNDTVAVDVDGQITREAVSYRLKVSGSHYGIQASSTHLSFFGQLAAWNTQNVFNGFQPSTAPVLTVP